jgi:cyclic-di-AMP phosphodiesterase PgpH
VLTQQRQEAARQTISPIYDPPNPAVARQQTALASDILAYIDNIRRGAYDSTQEKMSDLKKITAVTLDDEAITEILAIDSDTWRAIENEVIAVLERSFQGRVTPAELSSVRNTLPTQVGVNFDDQELRVIVAIVRDLLRPNSLENVEATEQARQEAAASVTAVPIRFERGQIIISAGEPVDEVDLEAIARLGLLQPASTRMEGIVRGFLASVIVMVVTGLYAARFRPSLLYREPRLLILLAIIFMIVLAGARLGLGGQIYIYPFSVLALLFVSVGGPYMAVIGSIGLAFLVGLMADGSLEITSLVGVGGLIGSLTMRRSERLNSFFFAGLMVAVSNVAVIALFNLNTATVTSPDLPTKFVYSLLNGILTATAAIAGLYIVTLIFNLPTALKLSELLQPNQPLMQRMLRDAPGTYQHSLQVANLAEQAASAIGANAELTHVGALYHDIGKMINPAFFVENQRDIGNPHDALNDPYRSADIIIGHVTEGDEMAHQHRLPNRLRDFIREHHGTSEVFVFYKQAVALAGDDEAMVDIEDFRYPGPRPQSRETAVLMMADSTEAAVRSRQPKSKQEIAEIVNQVIESKRKTGQLDESDLTINDLNIIRRVFVEILQGMFHPRINYDEAVARVRRSGSVGRKPAKTSPGPLESPAPATSSTEIVAVNRADPPKSDAPANAKSNSVCVNHSPFRLSARQWKFNWLRVMTMSRCRKCLNCGGRRRIRRRTNLPMGQKQTRSRKIPNRTTARKKQNHDG